MSDTQKPVEETPAASATPAEPTPAAEPAAASDEITSETPAPAAEAVKAEEKKGDAEPAEPVAAGHLGYKAPGLVNAFRFSKKYFWFGKEPVKTDNLHSYLRGEKPGIAHPTAAWSHQTGEGLLYFSKSAEQKEKPSGVINLAHVEEVFKDGLNDFYFKLHGHKHVFQSNATERDAWVDAFKSKIEEAKKLAKTIPESQGYKDIQEKLGKSATAPVSPETEETPKKSTDKAPEGVKKDNASGSDEESGKKKHSRSISRKRASIFGSLLGKKDDAEAKKEAKPEKEEVKAAEGEDAKPEEPVAAEPAPVATEASKPDEPAPVAEGPNEPAVEQKEAPKPSKRGSIFGSILRREGRGVPSPVEKKEDAAPAVPAKDAEAVPASGPTEESASKPSETTEETPAPVSSSPKKSGFLDKIKGLAHSDKKEEPEVAPKADEPATAPATAPAPEATPATETETTAPAEPAAESTEPTATAEPSKARRRSSFFTDLVGKVGKKPGEVTSDSEGEPKEKSSPLPKIVGGLFRGTSRAGRQKKDEAKKDATPATVEETPETAPAEETTPAAEPKSEEAPAAPEPTQTNVVNGAIGDVVPDAITVGQTPQQVQAAA